MDKIKIFSVYLLEQILLDYRLAGKSDRVERTKLEDQAYTIASELIKTQPSLSLHNLEICVPMARRRLTKVDYNTIVKTLASEEYQQSVKDFLDANRKEKLIENHSIPASMYWKTAYSQLFEKYFDGTNQVAIREQADIIENEGLEQGIDLSSVFRGEI